MEQEKTEELLRKYYDGLTSPEEEKELRDLLDSSADEGEFAPDKILLSAGRAGVPEPSEEFMRNLEEVTFRADPHRVSPGLSRGLSRGVSRGLSRGVSRGLSRGFSRGLSRRSSRRMYWYTLSAAAGVALMFGSYFIFRTVSSGEPADTFSDPEMAMAEVRSILLNVSQNMNTGTGALRTISTMSAMPGAINKMGRTARSVDRSLSRLHYLNDLNPAGEEKEKNNE